MVSSKGAGRLASLSILFTMIRAQIDPTFTRSNPTTTTSSSAAATASSAKISSSTPAVATPSSSTSTAKASFTTAVVPLYLYRAVESLLDDFPSTRPNYFTALSWPSKLVIGTATYGLQTAAATATTESSRTATVTTGSQRASAVSTQSTNQNRDKRLGIILGVVLGSVALALMGVLFWCLARRKKKAGSFFMRRSTPSTSSTRSGQFGQLGAASRTGGKASRVRSMSAMQHDNPALLRPAPSHNQSSRSTTEYMPFHTPLGSPTDKSYEQDLEGQRVELARIIRGDSAYPQQSRSSKPAGRPPPFSPESLHQVQHPLPLNSNRVSDDVVSPISPSKSFERESTSIVHYPSMDEVNDFDFAGDGRKRASTGGQKGWHPARERIDGRHEMA